MTCLLVARRSVSTSLVALALLVAAPAAADDPPPIEVTLSPWASHDGVDRPYRYILRVRPSGSDPVEVVADRRLLSFTLTPAGGARGRRHRCAHPAAPRTVPSGRERTLTPGAGEDAAHVEWIDLRMYCWGRALDALEAGADVAPRYGFRRRSRRVWVARAPGSELREWTAHVDLEPFTTPPAPRPDETTAAPADDTAADDDVATSAPARLALADRSVRRGGSLSFPVSVRAAEGSARVYTRPDAFSFVVEGPLGTVRCEVEPGGGSPAPDLYRRITTRARARETLDADAFCPEDTFALAGVYEVTPEVRLEHSGEEYGLDAVTGTFVGPPAFVRVTAGERGYVLQVPEASDEASP